jgi:hypothetical protein
MTFESARETRMRDQVFISYGHNDAVWMEKISAQLKVIQRTGRLEIWTDQKIEPGQNWLEQINKAIRRAPVALLLASAPFLGSDFIQNQEIPKILKKHQEDGLFADLMLQYQHI